ncbi:MULTISPECIES: GGDEF domain-containing protein [unclassified Luteimonas]|uniref:GGDEF domain-containing protein n=1 Tax=unclassified Luteimonas TaxID=2629088 RepID=UPI0018F06EAE|nr:MULTISPECIES: GGDEF domain-containing protein [unclassified Luteimonas]MBJ6982435.1 GGDEF domain-containing protein [Luteimonas sp. MC1572]MBJ7574987.1 GGDEF domain-containing protein [Luteimonas sp. MC1828]QQO03695.1 GGDEF domain-containing protein [Luteimonas sp. MC1572]
MHASEGRIRDTLQRLLAPPDELMRELGASGERLVAKVRAVLSALILLLPLVAAITGAGTPQVLLGLGAAVLANAMAMLWLALARHARRWPWLPYATGAWDVTLTTAALVLLALDDPMAGLHTVVAWCFYLIAIWFTALRNNGRVTLFVGALAIVQYAVLVGVLLATAPVHDALLSPEHGAVGIGGQVSRMALLVLATGLAATLVHRMQRLVELSGHDGLTGLPNRSWLLQRMPHVFATARNAGASLTLVLLDIDRFKRVNDEAGPQVGDRALRHIAATMSGVLAADEHLARIGGQEFVIVLQCPVGSAWERLDRLRRDLAERPFLPERGSDAFAFTFSAGLAAWPHDGGNTSALLGCADRRLKQAKAAGGNRIAARDA